MRRSGVIARDGPTPPRTRMDTGGSERLHAHTHTTLDPGGAERLHAHTHTTLAIVATRERVWMAAEQQQKKTGARSAEHVSGHVSPPDHCEEIGPYATHSAPFTQRRASRQQGTQATVLLAMQEITQIHKSRVPTAAWIEYA